jgi:hypothetical protein
MLSGNWLGRSESRARERGRPFNRVARKRKQCRLGRKKKNSPAAALSLLSSLSSFFAPSFSPSFQKNFQAAMINDEGQVVDLYIPRKW